PAAVATTKPQTPKPTTKPPATTPAAVVTTKSQTPKPITTKLPATTPAAVATTKAQTPKPTTTKQPITTTLPTTTTNPPTTTKLPTTTTTKQPTTTEALECDLTCPKPNGLFPHPRDCHKWVKCVDSFLFVKDCPDGLQFNPVERKCDWPNIANCIATEDASCIIPLPVPPTPGPDPRPDICDCECCLRPHPTDCESYYYCAPGANIEFHTCSSGLVFNPNLGQCVPAYTFPECPPESPPKCDPTCECLYPAETCSEYFKCDNGTAIKHECHHGLYFNDDIHSCDLRHNVDCNDHGKRNVIPGLNKFIKASDCEHLNGNFPREGYASQYYLCSGGTAFIMSCPSHSAFSAKQSKCVFTR
ncbi:unnamed protein product, partial [Meganyctiphanes norvegica]